MKLVLTVTRNMNGTRLSINLLILVFLGAAWLAGNIYEYLFTLIFILAHEAGHIAAAVIAGGDVYSVRILPVGINAEMDIGSCSKIQRVITYAVGPFMNFLLAVFFYIALSENISIHFTGLGLKINFYLAVFNLLPILPLDGGRLTMELFSGRFGVFRTGKGLHSITLLLSLAIISMGLVSLYNDKSNISLFIIGIYILMCIRTNKEETAFMNIKSLLFRKSRVIRKGIYPVREIVVLKHVKLSDVIKAMDYIDRFHIINILDDNMRVIKVMTEQELLDAIIQNTPDTTFDNLVKIEYNVRDEVN